MCPLSELEPQERGRVTAVLGSGGLRQRLLDMGVVPGVEIEVVRVAPLGDPVEYLVRGYRLSLRHSEAANVLVEKLTAAECGEPRVGCGRKRHRWRHRRGWLGWLRSRETEDKDEPQE